MARPTPEQQVAKFQAIWDRNGNTGRIGYQVDGTLVLGWYLRPTMERPIAYEQSKVKNLQHGINLARRKGMVGLYLPNDVQIDGVFPGALVPMTKLPEG